jgi:hypothetical protein
VRSGPWPALPKPERPERGLLHAFRRKTVAT